MLPAKVIVAPNSPRARAHASAAPATSDGARNGQRDAPERRPPSGAERCGGVLVARVDRPQPRFDRDHEERHGNERLGQDRSRRVERELDPEPVVELLPDQARAAEGEQQRDTADDRRHDHRQQNERPHEWAPDEVDAREQPRERHAEDDREPGRPDRGDQRQPQGLAGLLGRQVGPQVGPRSPLEQADERQGEERHGDRGDDHHEESAPAASAAGAGSMPHHAGRKPYFLRIFWPAGDATYLANALAVVGFAALASGAIG